MILLTLGQTAEKITVTLNEKRTIDTGYYLFVFTHILTRDVINVIYSFLDDDSNFQDRYNEFDINTNTVFLNKPVGIWLYNVYEQASSSNTDPDGLTEVEQGIMTLKPGSAFSFTSYNEPSSYKAYAG